MTHGRLARTELLPICLNVTRISPDQTHVLDDRREELSWFRTSVTS